MGARVRNLVRKCQSKPLGALVVVAAGFGRALTGWMLVMTVLLVFIGLPMFFLGLAVMQTQER